MTDNIRDDMAEVLNLHLKNYIKVKVKIVNADDQQRRKAEYFTLDPQYANYITLRLQIAQLFQIDGEFSVSFRRDDESYVPLASDWDLDGAVAENSDPYLSLAVRLEPIDNQTLAEWDIIVAADIPPMENEATRCSEDRKSLAGSIISQIEFTMQKVQRALSLDFKTEVRKKGVMDQIEYSNLFDHEGRLVNYGELHRAVFRGGGVDPHLRPAVWKHLLNVYPHKLTQAQRNAYMNAKCEEYYQLRYRWQQLIHAGTIPEVLNGITSMVRKDVNRTDRTEKFYSGSEDSGNVRMMFNILTTYAVNHPGISYCQGMSDLLSPILYVMRKESEAYICFCGLMRRSQSNFRPDGKSMKLKFRHMQKMLRFYDPELYCYLQDEGAMDLLFIYRWLLLDLKREFPFNDMLTLMEILWSSLPPRPPLLSLDLYDVKFPTPGILSALKDRTTAGDRLRMKEDHFGDGTLSESVINEDALLKIKKWTFRVRRESMAIDTPFTGDEIQLPIHYRKRKYRSYIAGKLGRMERPERTAELSIRSCKVTRRKNSKEPEVCQSWSCGEIFEEKPQVRDALYDAREFLRNQWCYSNTVNEIQLNNWLNGRQTAMKVSAAANDDDDDGDDDDEEEEEEEEVSDHRQRHGSSGSNYSATSDNYSEVESGNISPMGSGTGQGEGYESDLDSKETSSTVTMPDYVYTVYESGDYGDEYSEEDDLMDSMDGNESEEAGVYHGRKLGRLPPPHVLGDGNPMLLFLCITMIRNHRTEILQRRLDFSELGIYFDKFVRKHNLKKILRTAKKMFTEYLNMGWDVKDKGIVSSDEDS